jgi:hypothetical protein
MCRKKMYQIVENAYKSLFDANRYHDILKMNYKLNHYTEDDYDVLTIISDYINIELHHF